MGVCAEYNGVAKEELPQNVATTQVGWQKIKAIKLLKAIKLTASYLEG